ncbi:hypothetical protein SEA_AFLAC_92 [Gordonia phage Aflac]|uniref:Uncharacterized protein n=2 Tax=Kenoshavirus TaxID=2842796 RepID=A0A410TCN7_9CAUD|nr:hypothetical protein HWC06_gp92 [Gordonia phage Duffington]YP_009852194.1 hypothetical protein HWC66_gp92 [Gordonia phage Chikenjars]QKY79481.1 hypothetical protein SEA_JODELIE19_91 [Gordonia phage Jodelie19]QWY82424.1 hypothetical protein SEA_AFLAC_92 [Gordonia phage Aflac]QXO13097.1 hypothetical protein SEA_FIGLIAR_90 [Gordonia phage Figliar]QXO14116.1 hypothetical protein SEA_ALAINAMARIE_92 [Gordonia phage AlainaMarie]QYC54011.1 hypothetical protein SEA_NITHYA_91 [Gordonia phage Nithya]
MDEYMLSTADNPFNPFTQWEQWFAFDAREGYHTPAYLARVVRTSSELSEADQIVALNDGIDEILQYNLTGNYIKVTKPPVEAK